MPRYKLTIEYDGTGLAGWQKQPDRPSIQGYLEMAAEQINGVATEVLGAGRTDAGVHALAQVVHVDLLKPIKPYSVMQAFNFHLLPLTMQVIVIAAEEVSDDFQARFSATGRSYWYRIINRRSRLALAANRAWHIPEALDAAAMHKAAQLFVGHHDFTTFRSTACQAKSPLKTLDKLDVIRNGEEIHILTSSRSFLHHQVRNMVGTLRLIGNGKWSEADLLNALAAKDRTKGGETAPPDGLYLTGVRY
jgi:tRNA pseudouridine38-40 synthase